VERLSDLKDLDALPTAFQETVALRGNRRILQLPELIHVLEILLVLE
jgi:hypothetical protein